MKTLSPNPKDLFMIYPNMDKPNPFLKLAVHTYVAIRCGRATQDVIAEHTPLDPNTLPVKVGAFVTGEYVATRLDPATDRMVDSSVAWLKARYSTYVEAKNKYYEDKRNKASIPTN